MKIDLLEVEMLVKRCIGKHFEAWQESAMKSQSNQYAEVQKELQRGAAAGHDDDREILDTAAWKQLYEKFEKMIYSWIRKILHSRGYNSFNFEEDVDEIFCSVWEKVFHNIHALKNPRKFPGWLKTVTVHAAIDSMKYGSNHKIVSINDIVNGDGHTREEFIEAEENIEEEFIEKEEIENLKKVINELGEEEQFILTQHFSNGLKLEEISKLLDNKPVGTIGSIINRAKEKIRKIMKNIKRGDEKWNNH